MLVVVAAAGNEAEEDLIEYVALVAVVAVVAVAMPAAGVENVLRLGLKPHVHAILSTVYRTVGAFPGHQGLHRRP